MRGEEEGVDMRFSGSPEEAASSFPPGSCAQSIIEDPNLELVAGGSRVPVCLCQCVSLHVTSSGPGIDPATLERPSLLALRGCESAAAAGV